MNENIFQLTASQGGWPRTATNGSNTKHFNSQPHKEADGKYKKICGGNAISTHSLTRRLTLDVLIWYIVQNISTHSLTRRLTFRLCQSLQHQLYFNSQPHKEADNFVTIHDALNFISTHSLTRRLTELCNEQRYAILFQLTASQGGWRIWCNYVIKENYFNSQPHKEADEWVQ